MGNFPVDNLIANKIVLNNQDIQSPGAGKISVGGRVISDEKTPLSGLPDVRIINPENREVLLYDSNIRKWRNGIIQTGSGSGGGSYENPEIQFISGNGYNSILVIANGKLFTASTSNGDYWNSTTGRGYNDQDPCIGFKNITKVDLPTHSPIKKVGGGYHTFAYVLLENGELYVWGQNSNGQCGVAHTNPIPYPTLALTDVVEVYDNKSNASFNIDQNRLYVKRSDGYIYGAGWNGNGALGLGDTNNRSSFTKITSLGNDVKYFYNLGSTYGCAVAIKEDGTIWVAGNNENGQLGIGNTVNQAYFVEATANWAGIGRSVKRMINVTGGFGYSYYDYNYYTYRGISKISLHMMFERDDDSIVYSRSGNNEWGQLGDGTTNQRLAPLITVENGFKDLACEGGSPAAVKLLFSDGTLLGFGHSGQGQVGSGALNSNVLTPVQVATNVDKIFTDGICTPVNAYFVQSVIQKTDGSVWVCGFSDNSFYVPTKNTSSPFYIEVPEIKNMKMLGYYTSVSNGRAFFAVMPNNTIKAWGYNGQYSIAPYTNISFQKPLKISVDLT